MKRISLCFFLALLLVCSASMASDYNVVVSDTRIVDFGGTYNVMAYGAEADSVTDDTAAIQLAIDAAEAAGRGNVVLPPGVYSVNGDMITINGDNIKISGYGAKLVLAAGTYSSIMYVLGTRETVQYSAGFSTYSNVVIEGLEIDGNLSNITTTSGSTGILAQQVSDWTFRDLYIHDMPGEVGAGYGIGVTYSDDVTIDNCTINRTDRQNIIIWETLGAHIVNCNLTYSYYRGNIAVSANTPNDLQGSYAIIENCILDNQSTGNSGTNRNIRFSSTGAGQVIGCKMSATDEGVYLVEDQPRDFKISNCYIDSCSYGIYADVDTSATISIDNCTIVDCTDGIMLVNVEGHCVTTGCVITGTTNEPIYYSAVSDGVISGCTFDGGSNCTVAPPSGGHNIFIGNTLTSHTGASYSFFANGSGGGTVTYRGNYVYGNTVDKPRIDCFGDVHIPYTATPESAVIAQVGATCTNINGGASTTLYVKESGTAATGWVAK